MNYFQRLWTLLLVCAVLSDTDGATGQGTSQTCRDVDPHCDKYANICAPDVRNWAQQYCAKYCGLCTDAATTAQTLSQTTTNPAFHIIQNVFCMNADHISCAASGVKVICGNDGQLYPNDCEFAKAHCKNPSLKNDTVSHCTKPATTTSTTQRTTHRTTASAPTCQDVYLGSCERDYPGRCGEPLLATLCHKTCGFCHDASATTAPSMPASVRTTANPNAHNIHVIQNVFCLNADSISCAASGIDVICGSDGQLYPNNCEFAKAHCKNPSLKNDTVSHCTKPATTTSTTQRTTHRTTASAPTCQDVYLGSCERDYPGRCGEHLVATLCHKTCGVCHDASATTEPSIPSSVRTTLNPKIYNALQNVFCLNADSISCAAAGIDVICGNDGQLYQNECFFSKAHCKNPSLKNDTASHCTTPVLG